MAVTNNPGKQFHGWPFRCTK